MELQLFDIIDFGNRFYGIVDRHPYNDDLFIINLVEASQDVGFNFLADRYAVWCASYKELQSTYKGHTPHYVFRPKDDKNLYNILLRSSRIYDEEYCCKVYSRDCE